ncbi:MAG: hypothetical protein C0403_07230, partial [Desulfobacterium sp.]|nr:hypothetical protein [Desulfobacterium sp.]
MNNKDSNSSGRLEKLKALFRTFRGGKPDYENLDQADPYQTEEKYQKEQKRWLDEVRKKKMTDEPISKRLKSVTPAKADVQKRTENTGFQLSP